MIDRKVLAVLGGLTAAALLLTIWINVMGSHFFGEGDLSTGELLSANWWHPVLRLGTVWLWLFVITCWGGLGTFRLVSWVRHLESLN
ncbi:MAG: hypothetical protein M1370_09570 [Bacteroidetes bacterium]|nr:hypothetical protein [Bacteroidota bacterium]